jgi:hypothetical protein
VDCVILPWCFDNGHVEIEADMENQWEAPKGSLVWHITFLGLTTLVANINHLGEDEVLPMFQIESIMSFSPTF